MLTETEKQTLSQRLYQSSSKVLQRLFQELVQLYLYRDTFSDFARRFFKSFEQKRYSDHQIEVLFWLTLLIKDLKITSKFYSWNIWAIAKFDVCRSNERLADVNKILQKLNLISLWYSRSKFYILFWDLLPLISIKG